MWKFVLGLVLGIFGTCLVFFLTIRQVERHLKSVCPPPLEVHIESHMENKGA